MVGDVTSPQRKLGQKESIHIHCLPDELLLEILCRLPCSKFVIQCKSVCKRWASLISSPLFLGWFITDKGKHQVCSTLVRVHRSRESKDTWKGMMMYLKDLVFNIDNLSSSSLLSFKDGDATALTVHASCKDLLLYCRDELGKQDYYICNVQTQQWLPLPSLPFYHRSIYVAFTCDPYYSYSERKDNISRDNIILNPAYRYGVVIVPLSGRISGNDECSLVFKQ